MMLLKSIRRGVRTPIKTSWTYSRLFSSQEQRSQASGSLGLSEIVDRVLSAQQELGERSPAWINRVARLQNEANTAFKIAVVGDGYSGQNSLAIALAENTDLAKSIPTKHSIKDASVTASKIFRVSDGTPTESADANVVVDIAAPSPWLKSSNVELITANVQLQLGNNDVWDDTVGFADTLIYVVDALRPPVTRDEVEYILENAQKYNKSVIVAVNNYERVDSEEADAIVSNLQTLIKDLSTHDIKVFPISSSVALKALSLPSAKTNGQDFMQLWTDSGIQDLKMAVYPKLQEPQRNAERNNTYLSIASEAARRLKVDHETAASLLSSVGNRIRNVLVPGIVAGEQRLHKDFEKKDLEVVDQTSSNLVEALRTYLGKVGLVSLLIRSDISEDIKGKMLLYSLSDAGNKMFYATGRLNEGLFTLYERTKAELSAFTSASHPLSAYSPSKSFQDDVARILEILNKQQPPQGVEVNPTALHNVITSFDESQEADILQSKGDSLLRTSLISQVAVASSCVFFTYLGVPWAITIPSALATSVGVVGITSWRWSSLKQRFLLKIIEAQKTLKSRLLTVYDKDFTRVVADPLASIVRLLEDALEKRVEEAVAGKEKAEALISTINNNRK